MSEQLASGALAVHALEAAGVDHLFTLSGGHIFPLYDGCRQVGVQLWDFRHEQSATFAAEGLAKLTRSPQVAALTAGPGVTNGMSAVASARFGGSPLVVLGGRAPAATWGAGSLQEIDHTAFMGPLTKSAVTAMTPDEVAPTVAEALRLAGSAHRGPTFVDIPMDTVFTPAGTDTVPAPADPDRITHDPDDVAAIAAKLQAARSPVLIGGTDVWLDAAEEAFRHLAETLGAAVIQNGMGRGCIPADHPQVLSRARGAAFKSADLVVVIGTPLDFRLGFGHFGDAETVHVVDHPDQISRHANPAASAAGSLGPLLHALADAAGGPTGDLAEQRRTWIAGLRDTEEAAQAQDADLLTGGSSTPIHPARVYGALAEVLDRDAVVIGDGGDFVSYAGRYVQSHQPGRWLDPGPYGCLGTGMGYSAAARIAHPDVQVVLMLGDGAAGFSLMDVESLVRQDLPVVMICGNNGIWALEKYPMQQMYDGWDVAADLQPGLGYDQVVRAMNGAGETVTDAADLTAAIRRGFDAGVPYLVNVMTDPSVAYPRSTALV
ncbi:acetolactate synthase [Euzebya sp.]|uniref:acetolactate synthase n=1 Tax=Euzebya sp. TaxID=1971409 RepID=UPI00351100B0